MKKIILPGLLALSLLVVSPKHASAENHEQANDMEQNAECHQEAGAYGQNTCIIEQEQKVEQEQEISYVEGEVKGVMDEHEPVDAALDFKSSAVAVTTVTSAAGAMIIKLKNKLS